MDITGDKFKKVIAMMGSPEEHEATTAFLKVREILKERDKLWGDIIKIETEGQSQSENTHDYYSPNEEFYEQYYNYRREREQDYEPEQTNRFIGNNLFLILAGFCCLIGLWDVACALYDIGLTAELQAGLFIFLLTFFTFLFSGGGKGMAMTAFFILGVLGLTSATFSILRLVGSWL